MHGFDWVGLLSFDWVGLLGLDLASLLGFDFGFLVFLLFRGVVLSKLASFSAPAPLQFPRTGPRHSVLTTLSVSVFLVYSIAFGFSLVPPHCRWHPK